MNGLFLNNLVCDKEIIVKNGCIEVYNENAQLHFAIYPTTVHGDENHVNEFVQMQPQNIHQNRRSGESDNALIVRDLTRFGTSFILREGTINYLLTTPSQSTYAINDQHERKELFQLIRLQSLDQIYSC
jgi:hypothetical protein